jgi:hypothetical protein
MAGGPVVSREAVELIFRLCEQQPAQIAWQVLNMHFNRLGEELISTGALVETPPSETIVMPMDLDDELVGFGWDADRQAFVGFHPNMGLMEADLRVRKQYRIEFDWLLLAIAGAAGVAARQRRVCLVDDQLWDLGDGRLGHKMRPVLFARRLNSADALDLVARALIARQGRADGVLLTTSQRISSAVRLPGRHRVLHLRDCLDQGSRHFALDADVIAGGPLGAKPAGQRPVEMTPDGSWIRIREREYRFRGVIHGSIVRQVYEAWRDGAGPLRTQAVLEVAESKSKELAQAFSGRPDFKEIIGYDDGFCWLKVD